MNTPEKIFARNESLILAEVGKKVSNARGSRKKNVLDAFAGFREQGVKSVAHLFSSAALIDAGDYRRDTLPKYIWAIGVSK